MKNLRKDFDQELREAFRRAAELEQKDDLPLDKASRLYPLHCEFSELLLKEETIHTEEVTSSISTKRNSFVVGLRYAAAVLVIAVLMPIFLTSGKYIKVTKEHGYTIAESIKGYEYYKERGHYYFMTDEERLSYQEIGPIHRKYVPSYIPEACQYTYYHYQPRTSWKSSYSFYDINEETGEHVNGVKVFIFASGTDTVGTSKKGTHPPEIIELPNGDHAVIVKDNNTDIVIELFWANDEISIHIISDKFPFEELVKILEGIKYTTEFTN